MKSFHEWSLEPVPSMPDGEPVPQLTESTAEQIYLAGAKEKLKSLRCESCKFNRSWEHDGSAYGFDLCTNCKSPAFRTPIDNNFGCILHEPKEGE